MGFSGCCILCCVDVAISACVIKTIVVPLWTFSGGDQRSIATRTHGKDLPTRSRAFLPHDDAADGAQPARAVRSVDHTYVENGST